MSCDLKEDKVGARRTERRTLFQAEGPMKEKVMLSLHKGVPYMREFVTCGSSLHKRCLQSARWAPQNDV